MSPFFSEKKGCGACHHHFKFCKTFWLLLNTKWRNTAFQYFQRIRKVLIVVIFLIQLCETLSKREIVLCIVTLASLLIMATVVVRYTAFEGITENQCGNKSKTIRKFFLVIVFLPVGLYIHLPTNLQIEQIVQLFAEFLLLKTLLKL